MFQGVETAYEVDPYYFHFFLLLLGARNLAFSSLETLSTLLVEWKVQDRATVSNYPNRQQTG